MIIGAKGFQDFYSDVTAQNNHDCCQGEEGSCDTKDLRSIRLVSHETQD